MLYNVKSALYLSFVTMPSREIGAYQLGRHRMKMAPNWLPGCARRATNSSVDNLDAKKHLLSGDQADGDEKQQPVRSNPWKVAVAALGLTGLAGSAAVAHMEPCMTSPQTTGESALRWTQMLTSCQALEQDPTAPPSAEAMVPASTFLAPYADLSANAGMTVEMPGAPAPLTLPAIPPATPADVDTTGDTADADFEGAGDLENLSAFLQTMKGTGLPMRVTGANHLNIPKEVTNLGVEEGVANMYASAKFEVVPYEAATDRSERWSWEEGEWVYPKMAAYDDDAADMTRGWLRDVTVTGGHITVLKSQTGNHFAIFCPEEKLSDGDVDTRKKWAEPVVKYLKKFHDAKVMFVKRKADKMEYIDPVDRRTELTKKEKVTFEVVESSSAQHVLSLDAACDFLGRIIETGVLRLQGP